MAKRFGFLARSSALLVSIALTFPNSALALRQVGLEESSAREELANRLNRGNFPRGSDTSIAPPRPGGGCCGLKTDKAILRAQTSGAQRNLYY